MLGKFFRHHLSFLFFNHSDFILRVTSLRSRHQLNKKDYFPPPGYGIPKSERAQFKHPKVLDEKKLGRYGFYLSPGRLARDYFGVSFVLAVLMFSPLIKLEIATNIGGWGIAWYYWYGGAVLGYLLLLGLIYRWIYYYKMPPVLTSIWPLWPEPSYHLLQSVPHKVHLICRDKLITGDDAEGSLYWHPKPLAPVSRQPQKYAKGTPTLQNVLLDFAVFEFFFFGKSRVHVHESHKQGSKKGKKSKKTFDENSSEPLAEYDRRNETSWLYWLSPILVNYLMLVLMLPIAWVWLSNMGMECSPLEQGKFRCFDEGGFLIEPKQALNLSIIVWAGLTYGFMKIRLLRKLTGLKDKVEQGYFSRYLDLVPQQILKHMQGIPEAAIISSYILYLEKILAVAMFFAAMSYIGIVDGSF